MYLLYILRRQFDVATASDNLLMVTTSAQFTVIAVCLSVQGYKQQKAFIITENPTDRTCRNFWKMLYSRKCAAIVMLSQLVEDGQVCYSLSWCHPGLLFYFCWGGGEQPFQSMGLLSTVTSRN